MVGRITSGCITHTHKRAQNDTVFQGKESHPFSPKNRDGGGRIPTGGGGAGRARGTLNPQNLHFPKSNTLQIQHINVEMLYCTPKRQYRVDTVNMYKFLCLNPLYVRLAEVFHITVFKPVLTP